jgi:hypothetical protein
MDMYCSIDDAFNGPIMPPGSPAMAKKKKKTKESMIGTQAVFVPGEPDRFAEKPVASNDILESPQTQQAKSVSPNSDDRFFPLPGDTATPEAWQKAFMLEPDWTKTHNIPEQKYRPDGTVSVDGQPTLWKQVPSYTPAPASVQIQQSATKNMSENYPDLQKRLDELTQQIEALTIPTHLQSTAELFLFVAIGLVLLLAIDILLKYATVIAIRASAPPVNSVGGFRRMNKWYRK